MSLRTTAQLAQDFPVSTVALLKKSVALFESLVVEGFLGDTVELSQISASLFGAIAGKAETVAAPVAAYTGAAGPTTRIYSVVPTYPLPVAPGGAQNALGRYLNFIGGRSPHGQGTATTARAQDGGTSRCYGLASPATVVASTAAILDATDFVSITTPAAKAIPGVAFDIVVQYNANGPYFIVAADVAPATVVKDSGPIVGAGSYYGASYTPRALAEVGYDTASTSVVYGPRVR